MASDTLRYPQVAAYVRKTIRAPYGKSAACELHLQLMARPGRVLAPPGPAKWPAFVLDTCLALGGDAQECAISAVAATEFAVAALDVVDDLIDDDWDDDLLPRSRALNASLTLGWLAHRCASRLVEQQGTERTHRITALIAQGSLTSCAGQDLDLMPEATTAVDEERAHEMTRLESGSLVAMACQVGAAVAVDDSAVIAAVGVFVRHVGVIAQLLNDLTGVDRDTSQYSSDLRRKKKTLPVAFSLRCAQQERPIKVLNWYQESGLSSQDNGAPLAATIRDLGALHYTWVVAEAHRQEAMIALQTLGSMTGRREVRRLRRVVPALRIRARQQ